MSKTTFHEDTLLRLDDVIGNRKRGIVGLFPVGKSTWYAGVRDGRYPAPVRIGARAVAWQAKDILALIHSS